MCLYVTYISFISKQFVGGKWRRFLIGALGGTKSWCHWLVFDFLYYLLLTIYMYCFYIFYLCLRVNEDWNCFILWVITKDVARESNRFLYFKTVSSFKLMFWLHFVDTTTIDIFFDNIVFILLLQPWFLKLLFMVMFIFFKIVNLDLGRIFICMNWW